MANTIEYIIKLRDQFSAQLKTVGANAEKTFDGIKGRFDAAANVMKGDFSQLPNVFGNISGGALMAVSGIAAVGAAATAAAAEIKRINDATITYADSMRKVSQAAGVNADWLSSFTEVADDFAISTQSVNTALLRLNANIGSGAFKTAMTGLIPDSTLANIKNAQDAIPVLADVFKRLGPGAESSALAIQLFGRSGQELIPVLTQGSAELAKFQQAAVDSGAALTDTAMKQADMLRLMRDNFEDWKRSKEQAFAVSVGMQAEATWYLYLEETLQKGTRGFEALRIAMIRADEQMADVRAQAAALSVQADAAGTSVSRLGVAGGAAASGLSAAGGAARQASQWFGVAEHAASNAALGINRLARQITQFSVPKVGVAMERAMQFSGGGDIGEYWKRQYSVVLDQNDAVIQSFGGVGAAADMAVGRISAVTGAFAAGAQQMDDNAKLNTALSVATGQLSIADFAQTKAAQALSEAYKTGAINMQEAIGVTAALAKGTISTADAFQIAGDIGAKYSAEVQGVSDAVAGGAEALKGLTGRTGVALSDAALGAFAADLNKTITATVNVIGIDRVNAAKDAIKGLKDTITNITVTATVKTQKDDID